MKERPVENEVLSEGRRVHELLERAVREALSRDERESLGNSITDFLKWWHEAKPVPIIYCEPGFNQWQCEQQRKLTFMEDTKDIINAKNKTITGHADFIGWNDGVATIIDWKYGEGQKFILPRIEDDLQMLAYACMATQKEAHIYRVRISDCEYDYLHLDSEQLESGRELLETIAEEVASNPDKFTPGPHCEHCLASKNCAERSFSAMRNTEALINYVHPVPTLTHDQAKRYALARKALKDRLDDLDVALRKYLEEGNEIIEGEKRLALTGGKRDKVVDASSMQDIVKRKTNKYIGKTVVSMKELKQAFGKEAKEFIQHCKQEGLIVEQETTPTLRWIKTKG
jgi:hypothetical protein